MCPPRERPLQPQSGLISDTTAEVREYLHSVRSHAELGAFEEVKAYFTDLTKARIEELKQRQSEVLDSSARHEIDMKIWMTEACMATILDAVSNDVAYEA